MKITLHTIATVLYLTVVAADGQIGEYDSPPGGLEYTGEATELFCSVGTHCPKDKFCCAPDVACVNDACPVNVDARYTGGNWINGQLIMKREEAKVEMEWDA